MTITHIKSLLSTRKASLLCLGIAIAVRMVLQLYMLNIGGDKSYQLLATQNLVTGHGLTVNQVGAADLTKEFYEPLVGWPPGYSVLLAPLYLLCGKNLYLAAIILDWLTAIFFVVLARLLMRRAGIETWLLNLYTLFIGFFLYDFSNSSTTDFICLVFFIAAIHFALRYIDDPARRGAAVLTGILLFACMLIRYMYIPIVFVVPVYLFFVGRVNRNQYWMRGGWWSLGTLSVLLAGLLLFQQFYTGSATYVIPSQKGFFPENIIRMNPFVYSSFFDLAMVCSQMEKFTGIPYLRWVDFARWTNLLPASLLVAWALLYLYKKKFRQPDARMHITSLGILSSLATIGLLVALSLRNAAIITPTYPLWTFVEEPRYFAYILTFLQQAVFIYLLADKATWRHGLKKMVAGVAILLFFFQFLHGVYFTVKILWKDRNDFHIDKHDHALVQFTIDYIKVLKEKFPGQPIVVASSDPSFCNIGNMNGAIGMYQSAALNQANKIHSPRPALLLVVLRDKLFGQYQGFLDYPKKELVKEIGDHFFYVVPVGKADGE